MHKLLVLRDSPSQEQAHIHPQGQDCTHPWRCADVCPWGLLTCVLKDVEIVLKHVPSSMVRASSSSRIVLEGTHNITLNNPLCSGWAHVHPQAWYHVHLHSQGHAHMGPCEGEFCKCPWGWCWLHIVGFLEGGCHHDYQPPFFCVWIREGQTHFVWFLCAIIELLPLGCTLGGRGAWGGMWIFCICGIYQNPHTMYPPYGKDSNITIFHFTIFHQLARTRLMIG